MKVFLKFAIFGALAFGGAALSPALFLVFGSAIATAVFSAEIAAVGSALFVEILAGLPPGIFSMPVSLSVIAVETARTRLTENSPFSFILLFFLGVAVTSFLHVAAIAAA